jgi:uncharacterized protein (TIGR02266 family)
MSETRHFRTSPRPQIACQVALRRKDAPADAGPIISYTKDLSSGGLFFVTDQPFDTGERVTVVLSTPSTWEPLTLGAEVAWARPAAGEDPAGIGLQFVDLEPEQLIALTEFVASLDFEG